MSPLFVRREICALEAKEPFDPITLAYAKAVQAMQARPISDPTSWSYQAAIHATYEPAPKGADWNQCQHASWFFLPWHRMYVYFFERIVRAAVQVAGGPADFALPYWNYDRPYPGNTIPPAFRTAPQLPDGTPNPLYLPAPSRASTYMNGGQFDPSLTSPAAAERDTSFVSSRLVPGFGGGKEGPVHFGSSTGDLEARPHNVMHVAIGGPRSGHCAGGLMVDPSCAARDPIFWLHHGNIDRLWTRWIGLGGGRANPPDTSWMTAPFKFFNEKREEVTMTAAQVLDTAAQLGYVYDDAPSTSAPTPVKPAAGPESAPEPVAPPELVAASEQPVTLTGSSVAVDLGVPEETRELAKSAAAGSARVLVSLEDIKAESNPGLVYGVYLDLPAGADVDERRAYHVGNVALFGIEKMNDPDTRSDCAPGFPHLFDATSVVNRLGEAGRWDPSHVEVTFQPIDALPPPGEEDTWQGGRDESAAVEPVEIGRVAVFVG